MDGDGFIPNPDEEQEANWLVWLALVAALGVAVVAAVIQWFV